MYIPTSITVNIPSCISGQEMQEEVNKKRKGNISIFN